MHSGAHILFQVLYAHSDMHPPHTLKPAIHSLFLQILFLISIRGPLCLLKHTPKFQVLSENTINWHNGKRA